MKRKTISFIITLVMLLTQTACLKNADKAVNSTAPDYIVRDITEGLGLNAAGISTDNEVWKKELGIGASIYSLCYNKGDKSIYAMSSKGVDRYNAEGDFSCTVLDFLKYGINLDEAFIEKMCVDPSGSLYFLIFESGAAHVKKFEIAGADAQDGDGASSPGSAAEQAPAAEKKKIRLAAQASGRWLELAVSQFQAEHPDVEISIEDHKGAFYGASDTEEEFERRIDQFAAAINTAMMAGRGPDIICFSQNLPYRRYIDKNMFVNLGELMEKDTGFRKEELNLKVIDALQYNDGLYVMPLGYQFNVLFASRPILDKENLAIDDRSWTWNDFVKAAEKIRKDTDNDGKIDQFSTYLYSKEEIIFLLSDYEKFVDIENKKAYFATDEFISMLESCKAYTDKELFFIEGDIEKIKDMSQKGSIAFVQWPLSDYFSADFIKSYFFPDDVRLLRMPTDDADGAVSMEFIPGDMYAINRNAKYRDEAWEFLKLLLSKKYQSSTSFQAGFPINNEALKVIADRSRNVMGVKQETIDEVNGFIADVSEYRYYDKQARSIIKAEAAYFFAGSRSAEETARILQNKMDIYLNE